MMKIKPTIWKVLTLFVVVFLILNPETVGLAVFIDAVGLEIFMLMIELQIAALFGFFFHNSIKPALSDIRRFRLSSQFFHASSFAPAAMMHLLVFSSSLPLVIACLT
ncbi:MAG: hypothetical protein N0C88_12835 [Candidatus Thiodiazotropha lotti]|uniref:Uncharacterized protein n=1 Tax=Candidatus Thiodiazotropha lotti TaxID=2792787 RepID=A0A9E4K4X3_9GAMM|nr:hypothetical protein [Candidatus Thiodiazotropha lotti]MCG7931216.1 hypothetical protein [Candidatus Thiodiazotropha lotti]MCG7939717.1 hypothetical protein [Candidatus Thiodiazotropha lotti]MCW4204189.1 hypothetical protein [Candidatus Thiodiazotropha lotti]MCW4221061.1 hypothetical protein [Candidatus Thiodiazotropha lotti]